MGVCQTGGPEWALRSKVEGLAVGSVERALCGGPVQRSLYRQTLQTLAKSEKVKIWQNLGVPRSGQFDYKPRCGKGQFGAFGQLWPFKRSLRTLPGHGGGP